MPARTRHRSSITGALAGFILLAWHAAAMASPPACVADSGPTRTSLLELFTSEGCSSCPPADRWLSGLRARPAEQARLAPLAFHVDYWNRLGWVDRFSKPDYSARQRRLAGINRSRTVYTPQFVLDGRDWRPSRGDLLNDRAPGAQLRLELGPAEGGKLAVEGAASLLAGRAGAQLFLALYENNLSSRIEAGENVGSLLRHDFVVRRLVGPIDIPPGGAAPIRQVFALAPDWKRDDMGVTAFVQNPATGEVYQALQRPVCGALGTGR